MNGLLSDFSVLRFFNQQIYFPGEIRDVTLTNATSLNATAVHLEWAWQENHCHALYGVEVTKRSSQINLVRTHYVGSIQRVNHCNALYGVERPELSGPGYSGSEC